ncbi:unnamed protein product [Rotaria socialis]|uniref:Uncharacterized protein n=3 Tax=Rotaria socialis TaxID=392032 RepID=A0A817S8H8_9BILA|nr:unnamed protein product [Rotaria socialis]CAF3379818.1 unnamed protein product [Rotaria socialis]
MKNSFSIDTIIDINNNQQHSSSVSKRSSIVSTETNRHIKFNDDYDEKQGKRQTLTHIDFIHASENEILQRYLFYFDQYLPKYINEYFTNEIDIENYQLSNSRMHHKDDVELYHLKRIQMIFESIETAEKFPSDRDIIISIDAFHIYIENLLKKQFFINDCKTEQQSNKNEFSSMIDINYSDLFTMILISFNHVCHSTLNRIKPSKMAEILIILFHDIFSNMKDNSSKKTLALLIENYHRISDSTPKHKPISSLSTIENLTNDFRDETLFSLDNFLKSIEKSTIKCSHNIELFNCNYIPDETKNLLLKIFSTSNYEKYSFENHDDCLQVFLNILQKHF